MVDRLSDPLVVRQLLMMLETADDVRDYFTEIENLRHFSEQVYREHRIKLENEREKNDNEFRKKRNELEEEFHKLRRDYASTNE